MRNEPVKHDINIGPKGAERLKVLYAVLSGIPERNININFWGSGCSTDNLKNLKSNIGCAGGWATRYPEFRAQGLDTSVGGYPLYMDRQGYHALNAFFQTHCATQIFASGYESFEQEISLRSVQAMSHKQRLLRRIRRALQVTGHITRERNRQLAREDGAPA
jgi:hypothetical protein